MTAGQAEESRLILNQNRSDIVAWVGSNIVPHEAALRARLRRMAVSEEEINDIVQDAYVVPRQHLWRRFKVVI